MKFKLPLLFFLFSATLSWSQVSLTNGAPSSTINFSSSMQGSVGNGPFTAAGFQPTPAAGQLDSDAWASTGWSDGALAFGGTRTAASDHTRGTIAVAVTTGGFYSYTGAPQSAANPCLMIQPGGTDFAPGTLTLRIQNNGTSNITQLDVSYNLFVRNDQGRSSSFNFSHSSDDSSYTAVGALDYTTVAALDALGWVQVSTSPSRSTSITGLNIAPGSYYYIRWSSADIGGTGSRDELGIDDIALTATFSSPCTPPAVPSGSISGTTPACGSTSLSFSGTAVGPEVYYWQTSAAGTSTANNAASNLAVSTSGNYYVRTYNGTCWSASAVGPYAVTINTAVNIGTHPTNQSVTAPATAVFSVAATGTTLTYQWQESTDGGGIWNNVTSGTGGTTASYTTAATNVGMSGYQYRVIVSGALPCTAVTSSAAILTVTASVPEINLQGNSVNIADNDATPSLADHTDFGNAIVGSTTVARTFTIQNTGGAALTLAGANPYVTISGTNAADFSVTLAPSNSIAGAGSTTFQVTFAPSATGTRTATITINSNDSDESVYDFAIQGNGTRSNLSDLVLVAGSAPATISSTVNNNAPLTSATGVQVLQFKLRDGGAALSDADNLPTILTGFTIAQVSNTISTWTDAINTIELFDGTTRIAAGTVSTSTVVFSGLSISTPDNTEKTLTLRMSLKCPLGADAFDNERFGFSIANGTTTCSAAGSDKTTFTAVANAAATNAISVLATKLIFSAQPSITAVNGTMSTVTVTAADACGNTDFDYTAAVGVTSTGTMTGSPLSANAVTGVATFSGIVHTVVGTGFTLNATSGALANATSTLFDIVTVTVLAPGDLAIVGVNTTAASSSSEDEISFVCFQDIMPGTTIYLTDNGYERVTAGLWGNTEGIISITRTNAVLVKGTIVTIHTSDGGVNAGSDFTVYTCGSSDANWTKGVASPATVFFDLNKNDQVWITQGGTWGNVATGNHDATYNGNVLYGWTDIPWKTAPNYASTQGSTIYPTRECYTTDVANPETGASFVKFDDPINPDFSTVTNGRFDWIALINNPANWDYYTTDATYDSGGYDYIGAAACPAMVIAGNTYVNGKWSGKADTNWFNCGNWDTLVVPDSTVDVQVGDNTFDRPAIVDSSAPFASYYGAIAKAKNLTITGEKVEITANSTNKLEVHGNLIIDAPAGAIDMDDSNAGTADGQLYLYGNWTNNMGNAAFEEGNGTVHFTGSTPQIINNVTPAGTEAFYNVILNNNFQTSVSNDLLANGSMTVKTGKTLTVTAGDFASVQNDLTVENTATMDIQHEGSLVMVNDLGVVTNNGTTNVRKMSRLFDRYDYTFWSSPIVNAPISVFSGWQTNYIFKLNTANFRDDNNDSHDDNQDAWVFTPQAEVMSPGRGYAAMGLIGQTYPAQQGSVYSGRVNNGVITQPIALSLDNAKANDDFNLVGNPYPSAISADAFITANTDISGTLYFWTHEGNIQVAAINPGPQVQNFSPDDFAYYNLAGGTGTRSGLLTGNGNSNAPSGFIASGQGFQVDADAATSVTFNNSMRNIAHLNNDFYRTTTAVKDRIWLNLTNQEGIYSQQLIGFFPNATTGVDRGYDGSYVKSSTYAAFYSMIADKPYKIQGRSAFDVNDRVPLGFRSAYEKTYTVSIGDIEGELTNQNVYIEDLQLNIVHDLKASNYVFSTPAGEFNNRFVLRFTNTTLGTEGFEVTQNAVLIYADENIHASSSLERIKEIRVYDVLGRIIAEKNNVNATSTELSNVKATQSALIVKVTLENGQIVTKKVIH